MICKVTNNRWQARCFEAPMVGCRSVKDRGMLQSDMDGSRGFSFQEGSIVASPTSFHRRWGSLNARPGCRAPPSAVLERCGKRGGRRPPC